MLGAGVAAVAAGIAAERAFVRRDRKRPDADAGEPFGSIRGDTIAGVRSDDGTELYVEEWGSGPAIVLAHGFSLNLDLWHYQILDFARDYRVIAFDQRGHKRSARAPEGRWTIEALAEDLDAVIRAAGNEPVVVVGHSMGGMQILEFCRRHPESIGTRVAGIVLADTTAADVMDGMIPGIGRYVRATVQSLQEATMHALAVNVNRVDRLRGRVGNVAYLATRFMGFGPDPSPSKVAFLEKVLAETPTDVILSLLPAVEGVDVRAALDAIDVPVLVLVGSHDRLTPPGSAQRLVHAIKGAKLHVLRGAGHTAMFEKPEEFNAVVRRFIASLPGWTP